MRFTAFVSLAFVVLCASCKKQNNIPTGPNLIFKFKFDPAQPRLNNVGQPQAMAAGHAGQSPVFNQMSAHYLELSPGALTPLGAGAVLFRESETTAGGANAINFETARRTGDGEVFFNMPLKIIAPGDYEWLRLSLAYQNYDVKYFIDTVISGIPIQQEFPATVASFIGYNTYIKNYTIKNQNVAVNANKKQGYWGFETTVNFGGVSYPFSSTGQAPDGATTVVNPLFATSPVPPGSCVVTAAFAPGKLTITGNETNDIVVEISLSVNKSFEWIEVINDGKWSPTKGEAVTDMGIRGMIPKIL
jgi:hypothetical protein